MAGKHAAPGAESDASDLGTPTPSTSDRAASDPVARDEKALRIVGGNPNATEIAAVTAVLTGALEELAGELGRTAPTGPSAWEKSQRDIRKPLSPGAGNWRGFAG